MTTKKEDRRKRSMNTTKKGEKTKKKESYEEADYKDDIEKVKGYLVSSPRFSTLTKFLAARPIQRIGAAPKD